MWEYGHRFTCILCSSNIKCRHLRGCVGGTRCHQTHAAKETAEISVRYVCQAVFICLFHAKKEGMVLKIFSLEICISMRKRKKYNLHFKALQVPILAEIVDIYGTKRPAPDVSDNDVKKPHQFTSSWLNFSAFTPVSLRWELAHGLYTYTFCLFLLLFVTPLFIIFYLCDVFIFSESIC